MGLGVKQSIDSSGQLNGKEGELLLDVAVIGDHESSFLSEV